MAHEDCLFVSDQRSDTALIVFVCGGAPGVMCDVDVAFKFDLEHKVALVA
jgi:hypothetical protein